MGDRDTGRHPIRELYREAEARLLGASTPTRRRRWIKIIEERPALYVLVLVIAFAALWGLSWILS